MPWTAIAIGGSLLGGLFGSSKAAKEQKRMRKELQKQREFAMERWQHYLDTYGDLERIMVGEAETGVVADIAGVSSRAAADTAMSFDRQRDQTRRQAMSFGLDPTSGRYQGMDRSMGLNEALAESHNVGTSRENERRWADSETFGRRMGLWQQGRAMGDAAAQDVQGSTGALARMHGSNSQYWGDMANNMFAQAGFLGAYSLGVPQQPQQPQQGWNLNNNQPMQAFNAGQAPGLPMNHGLPPVNAQPVGGGSRYGLNPTYLTGY
jgi:hypothetical protein